MSWFSRLGQRFGNSKQSTKDPEAVSASYISFTHYSSTTESSEKRSLGAFGGVFTPSFLTIIGVIMYLRFSWIVGNAGLWHSLIIVVIANVITFITALSTSTIASSEKMETGGAYFMVSRVLGRKAGGSIGIPLFLSQSISIALYIIGFAESLNALAPDLPIRTISLVTLGILTLVALVGSGIMIRIQYLILVAIVLSLVSIFFGFNAEAGKAAGGPLLAPNYGEGESFWSVFAVFFPAVTGILAGVSMSGDLKNPAKSIPKGTLLAVIGGFVVYLLIPVVIAFSVDPTVMADPSALGNAARWPFLVTAGVFGATLSSAIGSLLGAPRTLQALGSDRVLPSFLAKGVGKNKEPVIALVFSLTLAFGALVLGDLNALAEVLTMFFLTTYMILNFSAAMEQLVGNPSFRPAFSVPWWLSLLGALACLAVMILINPLSAAIAVAIVLIIFLLMGRDKSIDGSQEGLWEGFWTNLFLKVARRMEKTKVNSTGKNWRPMIQAFAAEPDSHREMLTTAAMISRQGGSLSACAIVDPVHRSERHKIRILLEETIHSLEKGHAFVSVVETDNLHQGVVVASQASGFGPGLHNSVLIGLPSTNKSDKPYLQMLLKLIHINRNILLFKKGSSPWYASAQPIIVWWGGQETNVKLMLILARLAQSAQQMERSLILATIVNSQDQVAPAQEKLEQTLADLRMVGSVNVILNTGDHSALEVLQDHSKDASLTVLGMARPIEERRRGYMEQLRTVSSPLESCLFVLHNIDSQDYI